MRVEIIYGDRNLVDGVTTFNIFGNESGVVSFIIGQDDFGNWSSFSGQVLRDMLKSGITIREVED